MGTYFPLMVGVKNLVIELIEEATGRPPSPNDFVEYLKQKVETLYNLTT